MGGPARKLGHRGTADSEEVKSYLVLGSDRAALIDTGMGLAISGRLVEEITPLPISVIQSHAHNDHIGGAWQFEDVGIHPVRSDDLAGQSAARLADWFVESEMSGPLPPGFNPVGYSIPGKTPTRTYDEGDHIDPRGPDARGDPCARSSRGGLVLLDRASRTLYSTDVVYLGRCTCSILIRRFGLRRNTGAIVQRLSRTSIDSIPHTVRVRSPRA